jgi:hypothetical protein
MAGMATSNTAPNFPSELTQMPEGLSVRQAFGWAPANWAIGLMVFSSLVFTQPAAPTQGEYIGAAAAFVLGLLLLAYEVRRRRNPCVLARFPLHNQIGVYKRGKLDRTVQVEEVNLVLYHPRRTWGPLITTILAAIAFASFLIPGPVHLSRTDRVYMALASLLFVSFAASLIKTHLRCDTCMVPYAKRGSEWVLTPRKALPLLLSRVPQGNAGS